MKKFLKARKAKGFTLVELLIVLIIIGILAGALLLVAGAGTAKAKATKIVSDMRSAKAAALMAYADKNGAWNAVDTASMQAYLESGVAQAALTIEGPTSTDPIVYVKYDGSVDIDDNVEQKLADLRDPGGVPIYQSMNVASPDYASGTTVYMKVN